MKQHDMERITRIVIEPLGKIFGPYSREISHMMIEDLAGYSDDVLKKAIVLVRRTRMTQPKIAHILEACKQAAGTEAPAYHKPSTETAKLDSALAERMMRSPMGQIALREGVGHDVWMHAWRDGKSDFTQGDIARYKRAQKDAAEALREAFLHNREGTLSSALLSLHRTMQEREKELFERYYSGQQDAP